MSSNIFDRISFASLFFVIVLLPIFFLPFTRIPIENSKSLLLVIGLAVCVISWAIARFSDGKLVLPKSYALLSAFLIVVISLLSAIFSGASEMSFFGAMFDIGTFWFMFAAFLLMLMCSILFRDPKNARVVLLGIVLFSAVLLVFQVLRLFWPGALSLGVFGSKLGNLFGSWNALGVFAGFSTILSLIIIEFFSITKSLKILLQLLILISLAMVAAVSFSIVWVLVGFFSLIIFVYKLSVTYNAGESGERKISFPVFSFIVVMIALLFFISGQFLGGILPDRLVLPNTEVAPTFKSTFSVAKSTLKADPIFGVGPNKFSEAWGLYKPAGVNETQFWDIPFNSGTGVFPTFIITTGLLGTLAWISFFLLFFITGIKYSFALSKKDLNWQLIVFFLLSAYLFIASFLYFTGPVILLLAFAFAGIFIGMSSSLRPNGEIVISFLNDHRKSFFSIIILIFIMVASVALSFKYIERLASFFYFQKALAAPSIPAAEDYIVKTLRLYANDLYLRTYVQIYLVKLNSVVQKGVANLSTEDQASIQASFDQALNGAQLATGYNPGNYLNFQTLGSVYHNLGTLGNKEALTKALEAYTKASELNPLNPGLHYLMARVSLLNNQRAEAKTYANRALELKANYIEPLIILSQIARSEGNMTSAISYAERALAINPGNKDLSKYVADLKAGRNATLPTPEPETVE